MNEQLEAPGGDEIETTEPAEEQEISQELHAAAAGNPQVAGLLSEVRKERETRKSLSAKVKELETQAGQVSTLQQQLQKMQARMAALEPDAQALNNLPPEIREAAKRGKPADPDIADEEAAETARRYGLFDLQGQPDVKAGRAIRRDMKQQAREAAQEMARAEIGPVKAMAQEQQATYLTSLARQRAAEGYCKPEILEQVLATLPAEQRANTDAMNAALVMARGIGGPGTKTEITEPVYFEGSGGRRGLQPGPLSSLEQRAAKDTGMNEQQWKESTKTYTPGQAFRLE